MKLVRHARGQMEAFARVNDLAGMQKEMTESLAEVQRLRRELVVAAQSPTEAAARQAAKYLDREDAKAPSPAPSAPPPPPDGPSRAELERLYPALGARVGKHIKAGKSGIAAFGMDAELHSANLRTERMEGGADLLIEAALDRRLASAVAEAARQEPPPPPPEPESATK